MRYSRHFFRLAITTVLLVSSQGWSQETQRPNFLFILADDQAPYSLGAYGNTECSTPNLDALASRGLTFDGAYHMGAFLGAVCTASRHMIMSGRTVWHIPRATTRENVLTLLKTPLDAQPETKPNPHVPDGLEKNTLAAVFNRAGYDTMRTCKKGNSYPAANAQFTVVRDASRRQASEEMGSAWHAQQVLDYLDERQSTRDSDPFLIYFGLSHPHDPRHANDELLAKYGAVDDLQPGQECKPNAPKLPINYLDAHPFHHGHPNLRDEVAVQGVKSRRDEATIRNEKGREYACIENIDNQVGRVLKKLEAMGELENTYVVYTADHGIAIGRHGLMGKQSLYEHCWRVPYIVTGPGIAPGSRAMGNIYLLDTLATFCDLAGIAAPETNEGKSFRKVLEGRSETVRDVLFGVYCGGTKPGMRSVRKGSWKLIKYETLDGKVKETQLFDLSRNPNELLKEHHDPKIVGLIGNTPHRLHADLAEDQRFAGKLKEMEDLLLTEMKRLDDPYRFGEGYVNRPKPNRKKPKRNKQKVGAIDPK